MLRRLWAGSREINLTSLLDVLFCILFIVMLAGDQNEQGIKSDAQQQLEALEGEAQEQIEHLQSEIDQLNAQVTTYQNQMESYDVYHTEAVIITISNVREGENHKLIVSKGLENTEDSSFFMGTDRIEYIKQALRASITKHIDGTESHPIYIVFYCDRGTIYTQEYKAINDVLTDLQKEYKEVFFKEFEEVE